MCEKTEREAVAVLARCYVGWVGSGNSPYDFDDDVAMACLVQNDIRPSGLSADLDFLISRAMRAAMRESLQ